MCNRIKAVRNRVYLNAAADDKYPITFHTHMPTNVLKARKPAKDLFCNMGTEVDGLFVLFGVKFGFTT